MKLSGRQLAWIVLAASFGAGNAQAQVFERTTTLSPADVDLLDATGATHLENARRFLAEKQWDEAVDSIRRAMEGESGRLVRVAALAGMPPLFEHYVPVREFCQWRLAALARDAPEALAHYRSLADPLAEQWYRQASERRDEDLLWRLVNESFATSVGDDALQRLGDLALARGEHAKARILYQRIGPRLTEAAAAEDVYPDTNLAAADVRARLVLVSILEGASERAEAELESFRRLHGDAEGSLAGRQGKLADTLAALSSQSRSWPPRQRPDDWTTFGGNPSRTGSAAGPIDPAGKAIWTTPLPRLQSDRDLVGLGRLRVADDMKGLLSYFPIVAEDTVLVRVDARGQSFIAAHDLRSGQKRWQVDAPRSGGQRTGDSEDAEAPWEVSDAHAGLLRQVGVARYTLTVHGRKLFARMGSPVTASRRQSRPERQTILAKDQGFLMGYDLATEGKPLEGFPIRPESSEWSFEGTPLCDGARLYVAMRRIEQGRCQVHVACFALTSGGTPVDDSEDESRPAGRMLWRTKICSASTLGSGDFDELSHLLLSLDSGTLYCNSNLGAVAALDAASGQVRWLCKYPRAPFRSGDPDRHDDQFFRDLTPCLAAGELVIVAAADCDRLFALDRATGKLAWTTEPGTAADVVHLLGTSGRWLIASGDRLYWIDLQNGRVQARFPNTSSGGPMHAAANPRGLGRGILAGDLVYWPTRENIFVFRQSPRAAETGYVPEGVHEIPLLPRSASGGNLVYARGTLLIAAGDKLYAFDAGTSASGRQAAAAP
jgi:outer membrane protein assembly factor BamB